jgi:hypothetical protein
LTRHLGAAGYPARRAQMEILFLTTVLPAGRSTGGEIASQAVIDGLRSAGHSVTPVGYSRPEDRGTGRDPLAVEAGRRPIESEATSSARIALWTASGLVRRLPYSVAKYQSRAYRRSARALAMSGRFTFAVVDHLQGAWLVPILRRARLPFVLLAHNVERQLYTRRATETRHLRRRAYLREARMVGRLERALTQQAAAVWALTEEDARHFEGARQVHLLPVPSAFDSPSAPTEKHVDIALIGTWTWETTRVALTWFLDRVVPLLPPHLDIALAGRGAEWIGDSYTGVRALGFVPDAMLFLSSAKVVAVPALADTGVQIKTLDAIASGSRVVATSAAVRGLGPTPDSVRIADTPEAFARSLVELCSSSMPQGPVQGGIDWSRERRTRFLREIAVAMAEAS